MMKNSFSLRFGARLVFTMDLDGNGLLRLTYFIAIRFVLILCPALFVGSATHDLQSDVFEDSRMKVDGRYPLY